jgi:pentapeptide MXKDX repeat protein
VQDAKGRFRPVRVAVGRSGDGSTQILSGLDGGERVVASGQFLIDSEASLSGALERLHAGAAPGDAMEGAAMKGGGMSGNRMQGDAMQDDAMKQGAMQHDAMQQDAMSHDPMPSARTSSEPGSGNTGTRR